MKKSPVTSTWSTVNYVPFDQAVERYISVLGAKKLNKEIAETAVLEAIDSRRIKCRRIDQNYDFKQRHLSYYLPPEPATTWELMQTGRLLVHRETFDQWLESRAGEGYTEDFGAQKPLSEIEEKNVMIIVGAVLDVVLKQRTSSGRPYSLFTSQASFIEMLVNHWGHVPGISQKNLEVRFAAAREEFKAHKI